MKPTSSINAFATIRERVPRTVWIVVVLTLVIAVGAYLVYDKLLSGKSSATTDVVDSAYQKLADDLAHEIGAALEPYRAVLGDLAARDEIATALRAGDPTALTTLAAGLAPKLDGVLAFRILPAGTRNPLPDVKPPLTYASISMMIKAREEGKDVPAEAHLVGSPDEHLVMLKRVEAATTDAATPELLGFLHASVNLNVVREALARNPPKDAYVEIRQAPGGSIATSGIKPAGDPPVTNAHVPATRFIVVFMAPGAAPESAAGGGGMLLPIFALLLIVGVGVGFVLSRRRGVAVGTAVGDTVIFQGAIKAILEGAHPGLEQLLPGANRFGGGATVDIDLLGTRADGDDVTVIKPRASGNEDPTIPRPGPTHRDHALTDEAPSAPGDDAADAIPRSIFRTYDIRGIVGETLTEEGVYLIGRALGAEAESRGQKTVVIARDGRHSSEPFMQALAKGLLESGRDVLDIGLAPTPILYFATHYLDAHSGVMITGSHNPSEYNGLKIVLDGETLSGDAIQKIRRRILQEDFVDGTGSLQSTDIVAEYIRRISEEIPVTLGNALKVVVDCGNGVPGMVAPAILRAIGHDVIELFCTVDGDFPNHHPDPSQPENLQQLIGTVAAEGADLGLAFDGDGDRLGVVDGDGNVIWPDRQMILFSRDILSRNPGAKIIFDVKCSRLLAEDIAAHGGEPIMSKTGHSLIKARMLETGALLAGEMSGHIFFKERWYGFDDALYSAARLLEILVNSGKSPAEVFAELPGGVATPELRLDMPESRHADFMDKVLAAADFEYAEISTIDGLRVDFVDAWGLIRPSNTTPCLVLRFEGDDAAALDDVKARFRKLLLGVDPSLSLPF